LPASVYTPRAHDIYKKRFFRVAAPRPHSRMFLEQSTAPRRSEKNPQRSRVSQQKRVSGCCCACVSLFPPAFCLSAWLSLLLSASLPIKPARTHTHTHRRETRPPGPRVRTYTLRSSLSFPLSAPPSCRFARSHRENSRAKNFSFLFPSPSVHTSCALALADGRKTFFFFLYVPGEEERLLFAKEEGKKSSRSGTRRRS
jgi:hypothetical protein